MVLPLDTRNTVLDEIEVARGCLTAVAVHPREVFRPLIRQCAAAAIVAHNHPSGSPDPSPDTNFQARRPYQLFYDDGRIQDLGGIRLITSYGNGFYHGLQASLEKRYSSGLVLGASYTLSKAHGDGEANGNNDGGFPDPRDRSGGRGRPGR